jgi:hypothetical protein
MVENAPYQETGKIGDLEFRKYPALNVATVRGVPEREAFGFLFRYISGRNRTRTTVPMTAPVLSSQTIAMTAPVLSDGMSMSFVLPASFSRNDLPEPLDAEVVLEEIPSRDIAVISFRGTADRETVAAMTLRLKEKLKEHGIEGVGTPFLMRYNPPFIPGIFRRNEIGIGIRVP